jgi:SAM-dependent methyltransferase
MADMHSVDLLRSAQAYWDASAETYEQDFTSTLIGQLRRQAVWSELDRVFQLDQRILELNCGTGIDALHLAERGIRVVACDLSPRMVALGRERVNAARLGSRVQFRVLATEAIDSLADSAPFDGVFSNFSGLNCVEDLSSVARNLAALVRPGARAIFCMMGRLVPWEIAWFLAHGDSRRALWRLRRTGSSELEAQSVAVRCLSVSEITDRLHPYFRRRTWKSVGIAVPPSYMESWARRFSRTVKALARIDDVFGRVPIVRSMGDCVVMEFECGHEGKADHGSRTGVS